MLPQNKTDLEKAREYALRGDYSYALYYAHMVTVLASKINKDEEAVRAAGNLTLRIEQLIEIDFYERARRLGLNVTPDNKKALMEEHSPHYVRLSELVNKPIEIIINKISYLKRK